MIMKMLPICASSALELQSELTHLAHTPTKDHPMFHLYPITTPMSWHTRSVAAGPGIVNSTFGVDKRLVVKNTYLLLQVVAKRKSFNSSYL
jgi:hypothetical protein